MPQHLKSISHEKAISTTTGGKLNTLVHAQVMIIYLLLPLLVNIDATTFEVNISRKSNFNDN